MSTIERFIHIWEEEERVALAADRDRRLEALETDAETAAQNDAIMSQEVMQEIEEYEFKQGAVDSIYFDKKFVEINEDGEP